MNAPRTQRASNIELMRVIAMIMIITFHITRHSIRDQLVDKYLISLFDISDCFCHPKFYPQLMFLYLIMPMGKIGNGIFILISGYFMADRRIDLVRTGQKLIGQMAYMTLVLMFMSYTGFLLLYRHAEGVKVNLTSLERFNNNSWFIGYYIMVIIIAGLILNRYLRKWNRKTYLVLLIVIFTVVSFGWSGDFLSGISENLRILGLGIFYYSLGGYIRRYDPLRRVKGWVLAAIIAAVNVLVMISYHNQVLDAIVDYQFGDKSSYFIQPFEVMPEYSWITVILSICLFTLFTRLRIRPSRFINFLGSATFMIYLFHDNSFIYSLWKCMNWIRPLKSAPAVFVSRYIAWVALIFITGTVLYVIYKKIAKQIIRVWNRHAGDAPSVQN
ncbi:MAG: acyltransferase [Lachnospiraceae bacterium]|nr:acyltransferase [Lachnospiraceae bacterium]